MQRYIDSPKSSTPYRQSVQPSRQKDLPLSEKFLARARAKKAKGEEYVHWMRAADILWRIENDKPVGHHRRRRGRRSSKGVTV